MIKIKEYHLMNYHKNYIIIKSNNNLKMNLILIIANFQDKEHLVQLKNVRVIMTKKNML